jgi:hypothetical protein
LTTRQIDGLALIGSVEGVSGRAASTMDEVSPMCRSVAVSVVRDPALEGTREPTSSRGYWDGLTGEGGSVPRVVP